MSEIDSEFGDALDTVSEEEPMETLNEENKEENKEEKKPEEIKKPLLPKKLNLASDLLKKASPNQRLRFDPKKNIMIFGPTQSGKTHFIWKLCIDGYIPYENMSGENRMPFEMIIYCGNEEPAKQVITAAAVHQWVNANILPKDGQMRAAFVSKSEIPNLANLLKKEEIVGLRKLVIIDDAVIEGTASFNQSIAALMQQGQHLKSSFIVVSHDSAGNSVRALRDASNYFVFCNSSEKSISLVTKQSNNQPLFNKLKQLTINNSPDYDKIIIWDGVKFYDKNLFPILT